jgi:hypothetical protein
MILEVGIGRCRPRQQEYLLRCYVLFTLQHFLWHTARGGPRPSRYRSFTITQRHTTFGRTSLDE